MTFDIDKVTLTELRELTSEEMDLYRPTSEEEKDYWTGEGDLTFTVISKSESPHKPHQYSYPKFEIDWEDYSGCIGGLDETLGIEYSVNEGILDVGKLHLGVTYHVQGITAHFTRGDGWTIDDDVDYYVENVTKIIYPHRFIAAWWWHLIGWRIRQWRNQRNEKS